MDTIPVEMETSLRKFADILVPSDNYIEQGQKMIEKVLNVIKRNSNYSVDRTIYAGSVGKATEIMDSDFDVVVFLNNSFPPFEKTISDWENILGMDETLKIDQDFVKTTRHSVQFSIQDSGIDVDLLPASNLVGGMANKPGGFNLAEFQRKEVMKLLNERNYQLYSSSLAETHIHFLKQQSGMAHQAVRLAKFWLKSLHFGKERPYGIKALLELIAVAAAMKEDGRESESLLRTFVKFLDDVKRIDELRLQFDNNAGGKWTVRNGIQSGVIDPANPFNNLSSNLAGFPHYLQNLKKFATITREKINPCVFGRVEHLYELFCPLKADLSFPRVEVMGDENQKYVSHNPSQIVNNEQVFKKNGRVRQDIEIIKNFLLIMANTVGTSASVAPGREPMPMRDVRIKMNEMIDTKMMGRSHSQWTPSTHGKKHEDYDITFIVPVLTRPDLGAVKYSFNWL